MPAFLQALAVGLMVVALVAVIVSAFAGIAGAIDWATFAEVVGSSIATVMAAGILWMLVYLAKTLDRIAPPQTTETKDAEPIEINPLSIK